MHAGEAAKQVSGVAVLGGSTNEYYFTFTSGAYTQTNPLRDNKRNVFIIAFFF